MQKQTQPISCSLPPSNQDSKKPSMAWQQGPQPTAGRSPGGADDRGAKLPSSPPADDFEFCILSSGGLALAGGDNAADDMCVADEVFSGGKLLPLRLSSAASADAASATLLLLRSDSLDGSAASSASTTATSSGFSSRSVSRSSSSSCVSRSSSSSSSTTNASSTTAVPARRSMSGSVFYAHPSPSPRRPPPPPRRSGTPAGAARSRRSTGSAPSPSWGLIRLGVVGAPEVLYAPPRSGSRSARFEAQHRESAPAADKEKDEKKLAALGLLLGAGLACSCSPDAVVAPVGSAEVAAAEEARRRRRKKKKVEEEKKKKKRAATVTAAAEQSGKSTTARRSRILEWLEDLSISKEKSAAASPCR